MDNLKWIGYIILNKLYIKLNRLCKNEWTEWIIIN